jgi:uncharacterized membrane protein YccC
VSWRSGTIDANDGAIWRRLYPVWADARPRILYGLRVWASVTLALLVAYWLELDNAYWAGTSAAIVCQPSLGASLRKGRFRAMGTVFGAILIVVLTSVFPQNREGFLTGLALWVALCSFLATILRNFASYAAALAGYTAVIVFADAVGNTGDTFHLAVTRASEICIGIFSAGLVLIMTDLGNARRRLASELSDVARSIAAGLVRTLTDGFDTQTSRMGRRALILRVVALETIIDEAMGEASSLRLRSRGVNAAVESLFVALSAWRGIGNHLDTLAEESGKTIAAPFVPAFSKIAETDWLSDPKGIRAICDEEMRQVLTMPVTDLAPCVLADRAVEALCALERAANVLVLVMMPGHERPDRTARRLDVPDMLPAMINTLRALVTVIAVELVWIETNWSGGQTMIIFTAIGVTLFTARLEGAYAAAAGFGIGTVFAAALAGILGFMILPSLQSFPGLSLALAAVFVPFGALSAGAWQKSFFTAIVVNFMPLLAPTNPPTYDLSGFLNSAFGIIAGTVAAAVSLRFIPPLSSVQRRQRLLALTLRDLQRLAVRPRWPDKSAWINLASQRLAAMPQQATFDDAARLLAALSIGEAVIYLRDARSGLPGRDALDRSFRRLAVADWGGARREFMQFGASQTEVAASEALAGMRARAAASAIAEALDRHAQYFASVGAPAER